MATKSGTGKMTKDQSETEKEILEMFNLFDRNGDKSISCDELGKAMRGMGFRLTNKEIRQAMKKIDVNKNGRIEYSEFRAFMLQRMKSAQDEADEEKQIRQAFRVFDRDGNGFIERRELERAMRTLGEALTPEELTLMMKDADVNGDGKIDYGEFVRMWTVGDTCTDNEK